MNSPNLIYADYYDLDVDKDYLRLVRTHKYDEA